MTAVITIWSDIACPWSRVAVERLWTTRDRLGLADEVAFDHRVFALEVVNGKPTPRHVYDAEVPVAGAITPDTTWRTWTADPSTYPVTMLPAMEAVQAAKAQGLEPSARLDRDLRTALYADSRCISMRHVILDVAKDAGLDVDALADALDAGRSRADVMAQHAEAIGGAAKGSPHLFLPDGSDALNPGIEMRWVGGDKRGGFPVVDRDEPAVYDDILRRAVG